MAQEEDAAGIEYQAATLMAASSTTMAWHSARRSQRRGPTPPGMVIYSWQIALARLVRTPMESRSAINASTRSGIAAAVEPP